MKKILMIIFFFLFVPNALAKDMESALLVGCDNYNTFTFLVDDEQKMYSLLGVEYSDSSYVCSLLKNANSILIEEDSNYDNDLNKKAWIWADEVLIQNLLIQNGLSFYEGENYKYTKDLCKIQDYAINSKMGIWEDIDTKGDCENIDYQDAKGIIDFESAMEASSSQMEETLEKIDESITNFTDNNMDKVSKYYMIIFIGLAFVVFLYKEFKG